jgi:hypothetical protein
LVVAIPFVYSYGISVGKSLVTLRATWPSYGHLIRIKYTGIPELTILAFKDSVNNLFDGNDLISTKVYQKNDGEQWSIGLAEMELILTENEKAKSKRYKAWRQMLRTVNAIESGEVKG